MRIQVEKVSHHQKSCAVAGILGGKAAALYLVQQSAGVKSIALDEGVRRCKPSEHTLQ